MDFTSEDIKTFIEMWEEAFGEQLSPEQAKLEANRLIEFVQGLASEPMDLTELDEVEDRPEVA